jgi:dihydrofolate reductase
VPSRALTYFVASSLDGYIAGPKGEIDWLFTDGDYGFKAFFDSIDTVITGRKTWEVAKSFEENPFAGKQIVVFSRNEGSEQVIYSSDPVAATSELLRHPGQGIWLLGGGEIAALLAEAGLVTDIIVTIHPTVLGEGIPLFKDLGSRLSLEIISTGFFPSGLVQIHYKVRSDPS